MAAATTTDTEVRAIVTASEGGGFDALSEGGGKVYYTQILEHLRKVAPSLGNFSFAKKIVRTFDHGHFYGIRGGAMPGGGQYPDAGLLGTVDGVLEKEEFCEYVACMRKWDAFFLAHGAAGSDGVRWITTADIKAAALNRETGLFAFPSLGADSHVREATAELFKNNEPKFAARLSAIIQIISDHADSDDEDGAAYSYKAFIDVMLAITSVAFWYRAKQLSSAEGGANFHDEDYLTANLQGLWLAF